MVLGTRIGLSPSDFVLNWDPAPPPKGDGAIPKFSAHFYCGQTAGCIKMPLGMEVSLSDFVLDGDSVPPKFSAHVYYSYCNFVRTLHSRYCFVQVQVQVLVLYDSILEKKFNRTQFVPM